MNDAYERRAYIPVPSCMTNVFAVEEDIFKWDFDLLLNKLVQTV